MRRRVVTVHCLSVDCEHALYLFTESILDALESKGAMVIAKKPSEVQTAAYDAAMPNGSLQVRELTVGEQIAVAGGTKVTEQAKQVPNINGS
jgi:hypothetical protein